VFQNSSHGKSVDISIVVLLLLLLVFCDDVGDGTVGSGGGFRWRGVRVSCFCVRHGGNRGILYDSNKRLNSE
jgi:hypothetical protein